MASYKAILESSYYGADKEFEFEAPDNATNGDIMKNTFPNVLVKIFEDMNTVIFGNAQFDLDWWNAPYEEKRGNENDI